MEHLLSILSPKDKTCVCLQYWRPYEAVSLQQCNTGSTFHVYKDFNVTLMNRYGNGHCMLLSCHKGEWELITSQFTQQSCNIDGNVVGKCDNSSAMVHNTDYTASKEYCLKNNKLLLSSSYCTQTSNPSIGTNAWTNIFREEFEVNLTKLDTASQLIICFSGTLYENNSKIVLVTKGEDCSQKLYWFLCNSNDSRVETTYSTPQSTVISRLTRTRRLSVDVVTTNSQAPRVNYTTIARRKQEANANPSSEFPLGAVIGGVISVLVGVALITLLILCKVRTCGIFKASNIKEKDGIFPKATYDDNNITLAINSVTTTSSPTYGLAYQVQSNSNTYAVVNKIRTTEASSNDVDTYTASSYGEYDRLNDVHKREIKSQENLYDSNRGKRNESDPTYDRSDIGERKRYTHVNDIDMYDHSFTSSNNGEYNCFSDLNVAVKTT